MSVVSLFMDLNTATQFGRWNSIQLKRVASLRSTCYHGGTQVGLKLKSKIDALKETSLSWGKGLQIDPDGGSYYLTESQLTSVLKPAKNVFWEHG